MQLKTNPRSLWVPERAVYPVVRDILIADGCGACAARGGAYVGGSGQQHIGTDKKSPLAR